MANGVSALTDSSRPQAESSWDFFYNGLAVFHLGEKNPIATHFLDTGVGQHLNAIASESTLQCVSTRTKGALNVEKTYLGILRECFIISVQDVSSALDDVDRHLVSYNARERMKQIFI